MQGCAAGSDHAQNAPAHGMLPALSLHSKCMLTPEQAQPYHLGPHLLIRRQAAEQKHLMMQIPYGVASLCSNACWEVFWLVESCEQDMLGSDLQLADGPLLHLHVHWNCCPARLLQLVTRAFCGQGQPLSSPQVSWWHKSLLQ